jgi:hypothetical protein
MTMKRILLFALTFCLTAAALSIVSSAIGDTSWLENDQLKEVGELLNIDYIILAITVIALIATIVSVVLLTKDIKKMTARLEEKKNEDNSLEDKK